MSYEQPIGGNPQNQQNNLPENSPKDNKRSPFLTGIIAIVFIFIIIICLLTFKSCSVKKKGELSTGQNQQQVQKTVENSSSTENGDSAEKANLLGSGKDSNETSKEKVESKETTETSKVDNSDKEVDPSNVDSSEGTFKLLDEDPTFVTETTVNATIMGKGVYSAYGSAVYCLNIAIPEGEEESFCQYKYYCSKKTYDNVNFGDIVIITYGKTEDGLIAIESIQK